jgi:hypothetical protein
MDFSPTYRPHYDPFVILRNCRNADRSSEPQMPMFREKREKKLMLFSIICTRKMAARLEEERQNN